MKEQLEKALWERVKSTYPSGTSKHTNALLEEDFNDFIEQVVKLCTIHHVVGRSEQLKAFYYYVDMEWANGSLTDNVDDVIDGFKKSL
jgi:hypothetical protein